MNGGTVRRSPLIFTFVAFGAAGSAADEPTCDVDAFIQ